MPAIVTPHTLADGETIDAARLNANFAEYASKALNKVGDAMTGDLTTTGTITATGLIETDSGELRLDNAAGQVWSPTTLSYFMAERTYGLFTEPKSVSVANDASMTIGAASSFNCFALVVSMEDSHGALFFLRGGNNATSEYLDVGGIFTNTLGSASSVNVTYDGSANYVIQNKRGGTRNFKVWLLGDAA